MSSNEYGLIEPAHPNASNSARPRNNNFTRNNGESQIAKMIVGTICLMFIIPLILAFVASIFLFPKILDKIEDVSEDGPTLERNPDEELGAEEHALYELFGEGDRHTDGDARQDGFDQFLGRFGFGVLLPDIQPK